MGCCVSCSKNCNNKAQAPAPSKHQHLLDRSLVPESDTTDAKHNDGKAFDEETVKEVLSETPTPKPAFPKPEEEEALKKPLKQLPSFPKIVEEEEDKNAPFVKAPFEEAISEDSELYSFSESVSTSAATELTTREDDGEVTQRSRSPAIPRKRSFAGRAERGGKSPARRSPARKNDNTGKSFSEVGQTAARRRILAQNGPRRDYGETSCRRSRSPVSRTDSGIKGACQSPSSRRVPVKQDNGRSPASTSERRWMVEEGRDENWVTKESLEDPLVSLECFIFL